MIHCKGRTTKAQRLSAERILKNLIEGTGDTQFEATVQNGTIEITGENVPFDKVTIDLSNVENSKLKLEYGRHKGDDINTHMWVIQFKHILEESIMETFGGAVPEPKQVPNLASFPKRQKMFIPKEQKLRQFVN